jgi:DNA-binding NtrC family response regulator
MLNYLPPDTGDLDSARIILDLLEKRIPASSWDLLHWNSLEESRFLFHRLREPHPQLGRIEDDHSPPPLILTGGESSKRGSQLSFDFNVPDTPDLVDWIWPLGRRGEAPWIYGRLPSSSLEMMRSRRDWLGFLFSDLSSSWTRATRSSPGTSRKVMSIVHHADSPLVDLLEQLERVARVETPVFLSGESGVGKELFAQALHRMSPRTKGTFVAQNGGALTDTLIESELFGHTRGSFTGAREERVGLFEMASGGTFFLDEVGDLSHNLQVRLLRVLQDRQIRRVGENRLRKVDFRLVTATHHDIEDLVRSKRFRLDLWFRIQGVSIRIPPLRERPMDIPVLVHTFIRESGNGQGQNMREVSRGAMQAIRNHSWPGNVRQLQNELNRVMAYYGDAPRLERWMLSDTVVPDAVSELPAGFRGLSLHDAQEDLERRMIRQALGRYSGNRSRTAKALGLSRQGLLKKLKRLGLERVALKVRGRIDS